MEKYKLKDFARWAKRERISDKSLIEVIGEMSRGLLGDRLGAIYTKSESRLMGEENGAVEE